MTKSDRKLLNLFDFRETELESGVDPSQNLRSANKVSRIHDPNVGRHFSVSLSLLFLSFWLCCSSLTALSPYENRVQIYMETGAGSFQIQNSLVDDTAHCPNRETSQR